MIEGKAEVEGGKVTYVPWHAKNDKTHKDCQDGVISSWNDDFVFVDYSKPGDIKRATAATHRENLIWRK